jgi:RNA-directed DNA polymerase
MPQDALPNGSASGRAEGPWSRVAGMQAKHHRWAAADPGRRFDDLFNFVHDPATLYVAYCRVAGNRGANTPGVDGLTVALVEERIGIREFLDDLRATVKGGTFRPLPVRERTCRPLTVLSGLALFLSAATGLAPPPPGLRVLAAVFA